MKTVLIARPYGYFSDDYSRPMTDEDRALMAEIRAEFHAIHPDAIEEDDYSEESNP